MLRVFRSNLKKFHPILWLVIFAFVFLVFQEFDNVQAPPETASLATVGGEEITVADFGRAYRNTIDQYRQAWQGEFDEDTAKQLGVPRQVLNSLIDERILRQEAGRIGIQVTDAELRTAILEVPGMKEDGKFIGKEAYDRLLRRNRLDPEAWENSLREQILTQKVAQTLVQTTFIGAGEVETAYRDENDTASIRYLSIPNTRFADQVAVTDGSLEQYFAGNKDDFELPERRVADYLLVDPSGLRDSVTLSGEEIQKYYDENLTDYTREEQVKARHILLRTGADRTVDEARSELLAIKARLEAGEDFGALATELSDDPGSKTNGGDLGFFGRGAMVPAFDEAAFTAELGDLVGPVETNFGLHLIQVQAQRPGGTQALEEVEPAIRARLTNERTQQLAESRANDFASRMSRGESSPEALKALADGAQGVTLTTTEPFGEGDNVTGIGAGTQFSSEAFALEQGASSGAFRTNRGWTVLTLREIQAPRAPELAEVRANVESAFRLNQQRVLAEAEAAALRAELTGGKTLDEVAESLDLTIEEAGPFGRLGRIGSLGEAYDVAASALSSEVGAFGEPVLRENDTVLFEVTERVRFDQAAFEEAKSELRNRLESQRFGEIQRSFINQRREELGVDETAVFAELSKYMDLAA